MQRKGEARALARLSGVFASVALAAALTGCMHSMNDFSMAGAPAAQSSAPIQLSQVPPPEAAPPVQPAALVEDDVRPIADTPPLAAVAPPRQTGPAFPNINAVPPKRPKGELLSPEEKAKVVAELEALARSQTVPAPKSVDCTKLTAEERSALKSGTVCK